MSPKSNGNTVGKPAPALLRAIARAHDWRERMVESPQRTVDRRKEWA
ncbi:MAG: hypothetical protein ABR902_13535 [Candidatus Korobacteraceae bacterium]